MLVDFDEIACSLKKHHNHSILVLDETIQATKRELECNNQHKSVKQVDKAGFTQVGAEIRSALMTAYALYEQHHKQLSDIDKRSVVYWIERF